MAPEGRNPEQTDTMSGSDTLLWTIGSDPVMRPTIVAVLVLSHSPDWPEVRARVSALTESVPRLRARATARPPGLGRPRFVRDAAFDLDTHLRRVRLPEHGNLRDVLDLAQTMATSGFDEALPLWEAVLVEDVDTDRSAFVLKVHHTLIDGVGGLAALAGLFDTPAAGRRRAASAPGGETAPGQGPTPPKPQGDLPRAVWLVDEAADAVLHPMRSLGQVAAIATSATRLMAPAGRPLSPIMTARGVRRHAEIIDLELRSLTAAADAWGGTVNDVFVSAVVRGLGLYHEQHGVSASGFRALMPINVRHDGDGEGGNRFVPARFVIPVHADVADCVAAVQRVTGEWKHAPGLAVSDVLADGLSVLPAAAARAIWGSMLMGNDFCITNVPGPPVPVAIAGAAVEGIYALSPPSGAALNVSLVSTSTRACIAITVDAAAVPDSAKLAGCIEDGFAEVCSARPRSPAGTR